jgi:hypothetical protein
MSIEDSEVGKLLDVLGFLCREKRAAALLSLESTSQITASDVPLKGIGDHHDGYRDDRRIGRR